jgi:hypothetical protein
MIPPSDRVPEKGPDWFLVDTEACGSGTSHLGLPEGFLEFFGYLWSKEAVEQGTEGANTPQAMPGVQGTAWWVFPTSSLPSGSFLALTVASVPEKSTKSFAVFGLRLIWIFCKTKTGQKTATGTWRYVNRLVP